MLRRINLSAAIIVIIGLLVLPPIWTLIRTSFANTMPDLSTAGFTLDHYINLVAGRNLAVSAVNSIVFATCATILSLIIGGILAWLVERTDEPLKGLAYVTTIVSLGTPYILYVTAWLYLLGRAGPFNDLYRTWIDPTSTPFNVNSLTGMILIEGFLWSPLVFLLLSSTFRAANADMEEAARMSGASILDTIRLISMKLARPALFALALFVFIRNIEAFEVPALVGMPGRVDVLTTELYKSIKEVPPRVGYASAFSVIMLIIVGALLFLYGKMSKQAERYASITGKGFRPRPFALGRGRWIAGLVILVNFAIVLALPVSAILWTSLMPFVRPMRWVALGTTHDQTLRGGGFVALLSRPCTQHADGFCRYRNCCYVARSGGCLACSSTEARGGYCRPVDHHAPRLPGLGSRHRFARDRIALSDPNLRNALVDRVSFRDPLYALRHAVRLLWRSADSF